jgi:hypothetical protein
MDLKGGQASSPDIGKRRIMGKRNIHSFKKFQKELKRKKKAGASAREKG